MSNLQKSYQKMKQRFEIEVANGVATFGEKKKYASPEIEVVNLEEQPKLLAQSFKSGFADDAEAEDEL
jgi:hypothetical protein